MINAFITWLVLVTVVLTFLSGCKTIEQAEESRPTIAPHGHVKFCLANPEHSACTRKESDGAS